MLGLMSSLIRKNRLPARIRGWAGTATGGHIHVVPISHTHPPKGLIQTLRIYLLGKKKKKRKKFLQVLFLEYRKDGWMQHALRVVLISGRPAVRAVLRDVEDRTDRQRGIRLVGQRVKPRLPQHRTHVVCMTHTAHSFPFASACLLAERTPSPLEKNEMWS